MIHSSTLHQGLPRKWNRALGDFHSLAGTVHDQPRRAQRCEGQACRGDACNGWKGRKHGKECDYILFYYIILYIILYYILYYIILYYIILYYILY